MQSTFDDFIKLQYSICNLHYSLLPAPGAGDGFGQNRVNFIQYFTFGAAFREGLSVDAFFAGTFDQIPDFEIIFIFKSFFCHFSAEQHSKT